jgi:hypothetical protein
MIVSDFWQSDFVLTLSGAKGTVEIAARNGARRPSCCTATQIINARKISRRRRNRHNLIRCGRGETENRIHFQRLRQVMRNKQHRHFALQLIDGLRKVFSRLLI